METQQRKPSGRPPASASQVNWDAVAIAYCTTRQSAREIGAAHGISHTAVQKHAKAKGWTRPEKKPGLIPVQKSSARPADAPIAEPLTDEDASEGQGGAALTMRQQRFVDEFLIDLNGTKAYMRAVPGTPEGSAKTLASRLLTKVHVQDAIAEGRAAQQARTGINADALLLQAAQIAFADPRELIETRVGCCRHCWGTAFKRQRTAGQRDVDLASWLKSGRAAEDFDEEGGVGFDPHRPPHPDCIECCGDGVSRDVIKDTRYLSPAAAQLYAGVKRTKDGLQVLMHDKAVYAEKLWRHLGLYEKDNSQRNDPLALRTMTDAERAVRVSTLLQSSPAMLEALKLVMGAGAQP